MSTDYTAQEPMIAALKMMRDATNGTYDAYRLAGPSNAKIRQEILSLLLGQKVPRAKAGVTALRSAMWDLHDTNGSCLAERERLFAAWADSI